METTKGHQSELDKAIARGELELKSTLAADESLTRWPSEDRADVEVSASPSVATRVDAVVLETTASVLNTTEPDVEEGMPTVLASANSASIQIARPVPDFLRQVSGLKSTAAPSITATKPKLWNTILSMLIPILFVVYALKVPSIYSVCVFGDLAFADNTTPTNFPSLS